MFFQLGTRQYNGLKSFASFGEDSEAIVVEYALIGRKPRLQGVANSLNSISLSFFFHQEFCVVKDEINALKTSKSSYEILPLLSGNGEVLGEYVIIQMSIDHTQMDDMGNTIAANISITLKENVQEDKQKQLQQAAAKNSFATGDKKPVTKSNRTNKPTCNKTVSGYTSSIDSNAAVVNKFVSAYTSYVTPNGCIQALQSMYKQLVSLYNGLTSNNLSCVSNASDVQSVCSRCMSNNTDLQNLLRSNFLSTFPNKLGIQNANLSLQTGIGVLKLKLSANIKSSIINQ